MIDASNIVFAVSQLKSQVWRCLLRCRIITDYLVLIVGRIRWKFGGDCPDALVSVIIATHDRGELLVDRTLPSVLEQTYSNIEVIVVADGSPRDTLLALERIQDSRVRILVLRQQGRYPRDIKARWFVAGAAPINSGLAAAQGQWVCRLDDDDLWDRTFIKESLAHIRHTEAEFLSSAYRVLDDAGDLIREVSPNQDNGFIGGHLTWFYRRYLRNFRYSMHSWHKKWDAPSDLDRAFRFRRSGVRIASAPITLSTVLPRPGNTNVGLSQHFEEAERDAS